MKYQSKERTKIITDKVLQSALKAILNNKCEITVIKHLVKDAKYKAAMVNALAKEIVKEVVLLPKRRESAFKAHNIDDMLHFEWEKQFQTLRQKVPTLMSILSPIFGEKLKHCFPHIVVGVCVLLYARCQQLNLLQYILGLTLDRCGLNKEVCI